MIKFFAALSNWLDCIHALKDGVSVRININDFSTFQKVRESLSEFGLFAVHRTTLNIHLLMGTCYGINFEIVSSDRRKTERRKT